MRLLCVVGIAFSGFLVYKLFTGTLSDLGGCEETPDENCAAVFGLKWGSSFGIPAIVLALLVYLGSFALTLVAGKAKKFAEQGIIALALGLVLSSLWYLGLLMALQLLCVFCVLAHLCGLATGGVVLLSTYRAIHFGIEVKAGMALAAGAVASVVFVAGQLMSSSEGAIYDAKTVASVEKAEEIRRQRNEEKVASYEFPTIPLEVPTGIFPVLGNREAGKVVVLALDYSLDRCRAIREHLDLLLATLGKEIGVVIVPVAINDQCNDFMPTELPSSKDACEIARYALAVWQAKPQEFLAYHELLIRGGRQFQRSVITGLVWHDVDSSGGVRAGSPSEPGIDRVRLELIANGRLLGSTHTNGSGEYLFNNVPLDVKFQVRIPDTNFDAGAPLAGMVNTYTTAGFGKNAGAEIDLSVLTPGRFDEDFSFVEKDRYTEPAEDVVRDASGDGGKILEFVDEARLQAVNMLGQGIVDSLAGDREIDEAMDAAAKVYGDLKFRSIFLPKVVFGSQVIDGEITGTPREFVRRVRQALGVKGSFPTEN